MGNAEHFKIFYIDISQENVEERMRNDLEKRGLVTFDQIHSVEELRLFCSKLGTSLAHRDADEYGVTRIINYEASLPEDGYQAFTNSAFERSR